MVGKAMHEAEIAIIAVTYPRIVLNGRWIG